MKKIKDIRHPEYLVLMGNWTKWRLTYEGGDLFIEHYLTQLSQRESLNDFHDRKKITYLPAFAKSTLNDVKNAIYQRMSEISRHGGSDTYQAAIAGGLNGVDLLGSTMTSFIGRRVIGELLSMAKVGIYIDMPRNVGRTLAEKGRKHPYIYMYKAEDILSWSKDDTENPNEFTSVLLRDSVYQKDESGLISEQVVMIRHVYLNNEGYVQIDFYADEEDVANPDSKGKVLDSIILSIRRIPFVTMELTDSLLTDVANYQIALLNLASADISFLTKANFPFYTEQFDPRTEIPGMRPTGTQSKNIQADGTQSPAQGTAADSDTSKTKEIKVGVSAGRRYPLGAERPAFINPSSDPIKASMEKQDAMKEEIRMLINLSLSNVKGKMASAESKQLDNQGLESGLSYIGLELEYAERKIAEYWAMYEGSNKVATVNYPTKYELRTEEEINAEIDTLQEKMDKVPSITYKKAIAKQIAFLLIGRKVDTPTLQKVYDEIESAKVIVTDIDKLIESVNTGLVSNETASEAAGYPKGEVEQAKKDHAERLARIAAAQTLQNADARGVKDMGMNPQGGSQEKTASRQVDNNPNTMIPPVRGEGK